MLHRLPCASLAHLGAEFVTRVFAAGVGAHDAAGPGGRGPTGSASRGTPATGLLPVGVRYGATEVATGRTLMPEVVAAYEAEMPRHGFEAAENSRTPCSGAAMKPRHPDRGRGCGWRVAGLQGRAMAQDA
ncbi:hypothetical protein ABZ871_00015 [Streptomyces populi]